MQTSHGKALVRCSILLFAAFFACRSASERNGPERTSHGDGNSSGTSLEKSGESIPTDPHAVEVLLERREGKFPSGNLRILADHKNIYWSEFATELGNHVYSAKKDGSDITRLGDFFQSRAPRGFVVHKDTIFLLDRMELRRYSIRQGKQLDSISLPESYYAGALAITDSTIYLVQRAAIDFIEIDRKTLSQKKFTIEGMPVGYGSSTFVTHSDGFLYISAGATQRLIKYDLSKRSHRVLSDASITDPLFRGPDPNEHNRYCDLLVYGDFVYWGVTRYANLTTKYAQAIFRVPKNGGVVERVALHPTSMGATMLLQLDPAREVLYSISSGTMRDSQLHSHNLRTRENTLLAKDLPTFFSFAFDGKHLYWGYEQYAFRMLPPPPGVKFTPRTIPSFVLKKRSSER